MSRTRVIPPSRSISTTTSELSCEGAKLRNFGMTLGIRDTRKIDHQYEKFPIGTSLTYGF